MQWELSCSVIPVQQLTWEMAKAAASCCYEAARAKYNNRLEMTSDGWRCPSLSISPKRPQSNEIEKKNRVPAPYQPVKVGH